MHCSQLSLSVPFRPKGEKSQEWDLHSLFVISMFENNNIFSIVENIVRLCISILKNNYA